VWGTRKIIVTEEEEEWKTRIRNVKRKEDWRGDENDNNYDESKMKEEKNIKKQ
jgi:hypothetical protein